jgi:hypothetical protein
MTPSLIPPAGSKIVTDFVVKHVETIYLKTYELDQNWADHAVAFVCWDMIMNQWSKAFHLLLENNITIKCLHPLGFPYLALPSLVWPGQGFHPWPSGRPCHGGCPSHQGRHFPCLRTRPHTSGLSWQLLSPRLLSTVPDIKIAGLAHLQVPSQDPSWLQLKLELNIYTVLNSAWTGQFKKVKLN